MKYHVNTSSKEDLAKINTIASRCVISSKKVIQFLNAFGCDNQRYQLIWGWINDNQVNLKFKGYKTFLRNMKVRKLEDWVDQTGTPIFKESTKMFIEDYVEMS